MAVGVGQQRIVQEPTPGYSAGTPAVGSADVIVMAIAYEVQ